MPTGAAGGPVAYVDGWPPEWAGVLVEGWTAVAPPDCNAADWPRIAIKAVRSGVSRSTCRGCHERRGSALQVT
jgi:hypothetical protein